MKKIISPLFCAALFFAACNDETTTVSATSDAEKVTAFNDLDDCDSTIVGKLVYVKDSVKVFACTDDGWAAMSGAVAKNASDGSDGKDGTSCSVKAIEGGYKVLCGGDSVGVLLNGTKGDSGAQGIQGVQGIQGIQGVTGESCSAKENKAEDGYDIECGGKKVGFIKNGTNGKSAYELSGTDKNLEQWIASLKGENGKPCSTKEVANGVEVSCPGSATVTISNGNDGSNGTSCNIDSDKDGVVVIKCGEGENAKITSLYKAVCGSTPYDPGTHFCAEGKVVPLCGGNDYNTKKFCVKDEDKLYDLCGGEPYNPVTHICGENDKPEKIIAKCGGVAYNPDEKFCDDRDNQVYKYVTIAPEGSDYSEIWMAQNLNYAVEVTGKDSSSFCYGDGVEGVTDRGVANCAKYGRLYTWAAADNNGCPEGWHLPSKAEWEDLIVAVGGGSGLGDNAAGKALKSQIGWETYDGISNDDTYSFAALPAGSYKFWEFDEEGNYANFWSSSAFEDSPVFVYCMVLSYDNDYTYFGQCANSQGLSVRCIKNKETQE